ncbi:MAG: hypothetical protein NT092_04830 [Bacteroidia bacterium]|nr:hypothetical protein [Bacteroidia bacterium]
MKNLALSSIIILLLSGCSLSLFNNFQPSSLPAASDKDSYSWFRKDAGRYLFQSSIDVYKNNFSGLLFVKPLEESYRILFITETGIKIFDMEFFKDGDYKLHYCLEEFNRKSIIKTLGNDLSLMLYSISENGKVKMMQEIDGRLIVKSKDRNGTRYCTINEKTNKVDDLIRTGTLSNKVNISFFSIAGRQPDSIRISHYNLKLKINLTKLDEIATEIPK